MDGLKCLSCGCTIPPDSSKCPNCGNKYAEVRPHNGSANGIKLGKTAFNLDCDTHGHIHITANVSLPPVRCPFC